MHVVVVLEFFHVSDAFQWFMRIFPSRQCWGLAGQTPTLLKDDKQGLLFSGKFNFVKVCLGKEDQGL